MRNPNPKPQAGSKSQVGALLERLGAKDQVLVVWVGVWGCGLRVADLGFTV